MDVATTAPDGSFSVTAPRPGCYYLEVDGGEYVPRDRSIDIIQRHVAPLSLTVVPTPVANILVLGTDGKPLVGEPLTVWSASPKGSAEDDVSLVNGKPIELRWDASTVPLPGEGVTIGARSATVGLRIVQLDHWPTEPMTLRLTPGAILHCHVLDAAGKPNTHATVGLELRYDYVTKMPLHWFIIPNSGRTDKNGDFELRNLPPGDYWLEIQDPTAQYNRRVIVTAPETSVTLKPDPIPAEH